MSRPPDSIGWVGLGAIGLPMATRAARHGFRVHAWDPAPERREAAAESGVELAASAADAGRRADRLVVCVVRSADQVADSLLGPGGALAAPGRVGLVMSSIGAGAMRSLATRAAPSSPLLDAPILGNPAAAESGRLTIPVSGPSHELEAARGLLRSLAESVIELGERPGIAQTVKAVSQQVQILGMVGTIEAMGLAAAEGVEEEAMLSILAASEPTWTTRNWDYARGLWRAGERGSSLGLFAKDLSAALSDAAESGVQMPLAESALAALEERLSPAP